MNTKSKSTKRSAILGLILLLFFFNSSCSSDTESESEQLTEWKCGTHNGNQLWTGPRGGCYYYNSNGNKTYVERSKCNC